ncbi:MAG TPA: hypothetical protein VHV47_09850 [Opitutaceae bacterium]|jgi:hypothetical protein|nr:hypothetical protein [Opitutaceae bacterium]
MKLAVVSLLLLLPAAARADHVDFVTISSSASKAYDQQRTTPSGPKPQTYVFYQGRFFAGGTHDPSIDHFTFNDVVHDLAPTLAKQNFLPTRDPKAADLLIVVNWGTTLEDYNSETSNPEYQFAQQQEQQDIAIDLASGSPIVQPALGFDASGDRTNALSSMSAQEQNARLLGYNAQLRKEEWRSWTMPIMDAEELSHRSDLIEERYFVILKAYDYQDILHHHPKGEAKPQPKAVWEIHMNVRAVGNNFTQALPAMARVAAAYYGKGLDGLATEQTDFDANEHVTIGASKVIGVEKSP